ncbi:MAG: hypothetical protein AAFY78_06570 [Cyanobacteria bacterium J06648_16]
MQAWQIFALFISLLVAVPLVLGGVYLVWGFSPIAASMVVAIGIVGLIAEGLWVLDKAVSSP